MECTECLQGDIHEWPPNTPPVRWVLVTQNRFMGQLAERILRVSVPPWWILLTADSFYTF
jgi:hypothetical protein